MLVYVNTALRYRDNSNRGGLKLASHWARRLDPNWLGTGSYIQMGFAWRFYLGKAPGMRGRRRDCTKMYKKSEWVYVHPATFETEKNIQASS